jgi:hypothetical protein
VGRGQSDGLERMSIANARSVGARIEMIATEVIDGTEIAIETGIEMGKETGIETDSHLL